MNLLTIIALALSLFVFVNVADRLRLINWRSAKWWAVVLQLVQLALVLWVLYDVFTVGVGWWQAVLLLVNLVWLHVTRPDWRFGPPLAVRSDYGDLGAAELERFR
ncbi:MAG TPA: hypothetical protein VNU71_13565 [Burkholderiaceae bacterium]|nr:hypothetical protein [Burkholderiaceae bacterium]